MEAPAETVMAQAATRLGTVEGTVRCLVDLDHRSHIGQVESALEVLGRRLVVEIRAGQVAEAPEAGVWMLHPPEAGGLFASSVRVILMHLDGWSGCEIGCMALVFVGVFGGHYAGDDSAEDGTAEKHHRCRCCLPHFGDAGLIPAVKHIDVLLTQLPNDIIDL